MVPVCSNTRNCIKKRMLSIMCIALTCFQIHCTVYNTVCSILLIAIIKFCVPVSLQVAKNKLLVCPDVICLSACCLNNAGTCCSLLLKFCFIEKAFLSTAIPNMTKLFSSSFLFPGLLLITINVYLDFGKKPLLIYHKDWLKRA